MQTPQRMVQDPSLKQLGRRHIKESGNRAVVFLHHVSQLVMTPQGEKQDAGKIVLALALPLPWGLLLAVRIGLA